MLEKILWSQQVRRRAITAWMEHIDDEPICRRATCRFIDLVQTAANVVSTGQTDDGVAGAAITAGQPIYLKASDGRWYPADNNVTVEEAGSQGIRIALNSAPGAGQPVKMHRSGSINVGATLVIGETYIVSSNAGAIAPIADIAATRFVTILGVATTAALLAVPSGGALVSGVAHA